MSHKSTVPYPYLQVVVTFTVFGSLIGGLIMQAALLWIFRKADFAQIGYQPLLYVGLLGLIPALLTGFTIASKQIWRNDYRSKRITFLIGFILSALYMGSMIIYLGIQTIEEVGLLVVATSMIGVFGGINATLASFFALPKACTASFDKVSKKGDDIYQGLLTSDNQQIE